MIMIELSKDKMRSKRLKRLLRGKEKENRKVI